MAAGGGLDWVSVGGFAIARTDTAGTAPPPLTKELIYVAVSVTNNCEYCIHSHTASARAKGMTDAQLAVAQAMYAGMRTSGGMQRYAGVMPGSEAEAAGLLDAYLEAERKREEEAARSAGSDSTGELSGERVAVPA